MENFKWAYFLTGAFTSPVIRINNATDFKNLQNLAKKNKLFYYETLMKRSYTEILKLLEFNAKSGTDFYHSSNRGKSFLVEYGAFKGFTFTLLNGYDEHRQDESEWIVYSMSEIMEELNLQPNT